MNSVGRKSALGVDKVNSVGRKSTVGWTHGMDKVDSAGGKSTPGWTKSILWVENQLWGGQS